MLAMMYINPAFWVVGLAILIGWARFITWVDSDLPNLPTQPEMLWKSINLSILVLCLIVFLVVPDFWVALAITVLLIATVVAWYWVVRVQEMGPAGHLFNTLVSGVSNRSEQREQDRHARQVALSYSRKGVPIPIPPPEDPMAAGIAMADQIVSQAVQRRAETVQLLPGSGAYELRFFIDGVTYPQPAMQRTTAEPVVQALKFMAGLEVEERRRPQQGEFTSRDADFSCHWTVRSSGTTAGERLFLTANEERQWRQPLDMLGLAAEQLTTVKTVTADTTGLVIVASPRHSGSTTTLYAMIRAHDAFTNGIHTLETNPRGELEGVTVSKFQNRAGDPTFGRTLQSIFLQDPTIVYASECPDGAAAESISRYAVDHRVYLRMIAFDTAATLEQWFKILGSRQAAAKSLRAVVSQRLPRLLCPTCKIPFQPDATMLRKLNLPVGRNLQCFKANTEGIPDAKGQRVVCPECQSTGYRDRTGIFEVLIVSDAVRAAIAGNSSVEQIKAVARGENMMLLVEHGFRKFASGMTSIQEVGRVCAPDKPARTAPAAAMQT